MHPAESLARTSTVHEVEESREQKGKQEEPGTVETEKQEDRAEQTPEQPFPNDQSGSEEQADS